MHSINWWTRRLDTNASLSASNAILNKYISAGPIGEELAREISRLIDVPYLTLTTSGSVALLTVLHAWGIGPGDEVIVPNRTFQATVNSVCFLGATPILAEVSAENSLVDAEQLAELITPKTKAVIAVHLNGRMCDIDNIKLLCLSKNILLLEDAAQALFSRNASGYAGTFGDAGIFSMGTSKFLTSGQGGIIVTKNKELHQKIQNYLNHGVVKSPGDSFPHFGFNFRLSDILSSVALSQINQLEKIRNSYLSQYRLYEKLLASIPSIELISSNITGGELPTWIEVRTKRRTQLLEHLLKYKIVARAFDPSLSRSPYLNSNKVFSVSQIFESQGLILPSGPDLTYSEWQQIELAIKGWE